MYLGVMLGGHFQMHTNFTIEMKFHVATPEGAAEAMSGLVFVVRSSDDIERSVAS